MKKIISAILSAVILLSATIIIPASNVRGITFVTNNLRFEWKSDNTLKVFEVIDKDVESIDIPENVGNAKVCEIAENTFKDMTNLKEITIPRYISRIGTDAFYGCSALDTVYFNAVKCSNYNANMFSSCNSIKTAVFGDEVTLIPAQIFNNVSTLENVTVGDNISNLGSNCLKNTKWEENQPEGAVYLGNALYKFKGEIPETFNVKKGTVCIGNWAFADSKIESINLPYSLKYIGQYTFSNCTKLKEIYLPEKIENIDYSAFSMCTSLEKVHFNKYLKYIGDYAFYKCKKLGMCDISNYYNIVVGDYAFYNCTNFNNKNTLNVSYVGNYSFAGCSSLTAVYLNDTVQVIPRNAFTNCSSLNIILGGNNVKEIGTLSFYGCTKLKNFSSTMSKVKVIHKNAFEGCTGLSYFPDTPELTEIMDNAFFNCTSLKDFNFGKKLTTIGEEAFYNTGITRYVLPDSLTSIGINAFSPHEGKTIVASYNSYAYKYSKLTKINFVGTDVLTSTTIEDTTISPLSGTEQTASYTQRPTSSTPTPSSTRQSVTYTKPTIMDRTESSTQHQIETTEKNEVSEMYTSYTIYPTTEQTTTSGGNTEAPAKLSLSKITMNSGTAKTIKVINGKAKSWSSSNKNVVKVTSGKVVALQKGTAKITVNLNNNKKLYCVVTVKTSPKLNKTSVTVKKGRTTKVTLSGKVSGINNVYTNTKLARINSKPSSTILIVKGLKVGSTKIRIKVNSVKVLTLKVRVTK